MVRLFMSGANIAETYAFERLQKIVAMQPTVIVFEAAAEGHIILGASIGPAVGTHVCAMKLMRLDIGGHDQPARVLARHGLLGNNMGPEKYCASSLGDELDEFKRILKMVENP